MISTTQEQIEETIQSQRNFFATNNTKELAFRRANLRKFRTIIQRYEPRILGALWDDLHKSPEESFITEISLVQNEIKKHIRNLPRWAKPERVNTPIYLWPSKSKVLKEPYGVALIIAPWNYPFQLLMNSLIGAISAGCCAVIKPSPYTPRTAEVIGEMIAEVFPKEYIFVAQGGREVNEMLLKQKFDFIFFTGSSALGRRVMKAASEYLTPVVLELGGKSPCIVDQDANIKIAAKRIAWGKTLNAGQTCISADYLLVHEDKKEELIAELIQKIEAMYGKDAKRSVHYPRIVREAAFDRIFSLMQQGKVRYGAEVDREQKYISPTIIDEVTLEHGLMREEIFGPVLPIITFKELEEAVALVNQFEKPLALYYFGRNGKSWRVLQETSSGGVCINDTVMHIANAALPFGGVGESGFGKYHGKRSFDAFSNQRAVLFSPTWVDWPLRYPPFKYFKVLRWLLTRM